MSEQSRYTAQEMREAADNFWVGGVVCEVKDKDGRVVKHIKHDAVIAMLRQAAEMRERAENRINELGKCNVCEEKNGGSCPALRGEEVTIWDCPDESCPNGAIVAELENLLHCNAKEAGDGGQ